MNQQEEASQSSEMLSSRYLFLPKLCLAKLESHPPSQATARLNSRLPAVSKTSNKETLPMDVQASAPFLFDRPNFDAGGKANQMADSS